MSEFAQDHEQKTRLLAELRRAEADLSVLRAAVIDLLNQLALLTRDDASYFWRIGGRPLDNAYLALKRAVDEATKGESK